MKAQLRKTGNQSGDRKVMVLTQLRLFTQSRLSRHTSNISERTKMGISAIEMAFEIPTTDREIEMYDVEKLRSLLPEKETELTQLEIILQAIKYIQDLQQDLERKKMSN